MPHTCAADGCKTGCWGGGFCKYHQYMRKKFGGDLYQKASNKTATPRSIPKRPKVPLESKTRTEERKTYSQHCKELEQELRSENQGKIYDFFTGLEIKRQVTFHHLLGRTGDFYTDKELLVPAENDENDGHLFYHRATVEQLFATKWYKDGFLPRLKIKSLTAYNKEIRKQEKSLFNSDQE